MRTKNQALHTTHICPMHPEVEQDTPGSCPKCGMRLEKHHGDGRVEMQHEKMGGVDDHTQMIVQMCAPWLWTNFTVMALGLWLVSSPFTFGYSGPMMMSDAPARRCRFALSN